MADLNAEGNRLRRDGKLQKAAETFQKALDIAASFESDEPEIRRREFGASYGLAEMYFIEDHPEQADPYSRRAIELAERMYTAHLTDPEAGSAWQTRVAYALELEGWAAATKDELEVAAESYRKAVAIRRGALAREPNSPRLRACLAITVSRWGTCEQKLGHNPAALAAFSESRGLHIENAAAEPDAERHTILIANSEICIANWHIIQGGDDHYRDATAWLDKAASRLNEVNRLTADRDRNLSAIQASRCLIGQMAD